MADWTVNDPLLQSFNVVNEGSQTYIVADVRFRGDGVETFDKTYRISGSNAVDTLRRRVFEDRATLQASESLVQDQEIDPLAGTSVEAAILNYQVAVRRLDALARLQTLLGLADGATIGSSGLTVTQVRNSLRTTASADLSSANAISMALSNFPL